MRDTLKKMPFIKHEKPKKEEICLNPEHNPPSHIVLEPGKHTYQCPACGKITKFEVPIITCKN